MSWDKQRNSNNVLYRICKKAILVLLIVVTPALLFLNTFHIKKAEVVGVKRYTQEQIKELVFQTIPDSNSLYLYLKYRFFEKPKLPFVEKIEVDMVDNHSVTIFVYEKMVAGCVEFMGEYLYFDKDGIVVESTSQKFDGIPVIKGLQFNEIILNEKLKVQKQKEELFDVIINLTQLIDKYQLEVDTVSFNSSNEVTMDIDGITVLLGRRDTYDVALSRLKNILPEVKDMEINLDMSKGTDSFTAKPKKTTE